MNRRILLPLLLLPLLLATSGCPSIASELVLEIPNMIVDEGETLRYDLSAFVSGYEVSLLVFEKVSGVGVVSGSEFIYEPSYEDTGEKEAVVRATSISGKSTEASFVIIVNDVNRPPVISKADGPDEMTEDTSITFSWTGEDPDGDAIEFDFRKNKEAWINNGSGNSHTWSGYAQTQHIFEVRAFDTKGAYSNLISWVFTYEPSNRPPILQIPEQRVVEGDTLLIELAGYAEDPDGDDIVFEILEGVGVIEDSIYKFTPDYDVLRQDLITSSSTECIGLDVRIRASDGKGGQSDCTFIVWVYDNNRPPVLNIPDQVVDAGKILTIDLLQYTEDPDVLDGFTYLVLSGEGYVTGSQYRLMTKESDSGKREVKIQVSDSMGATDTCEFNVQINASNLPPVVTKISGPSGKIFQKTSKFVWEAIDEDGYISDYSFRKDSGPWTSNGLSNSIEWSNYSLGSHWLEVRARDNNGVFSNTITWSFEYSLPIEYGAFKVANSWGIGGWERVPDGFLYITYEAMKKNRVYCFLTAPKDNYSPKALAVFEINHDIRDDCQIYVGAGDPAKPRVEKRFDDTNHRGGELPFPDNKMVLDITEFLPFSEEDLYLKILDNPKTSLTGTVTYFAIEVYDDYDSSSLASIHVSSDTPLNTINESSVMARIVGVSKSTARVPFLSKNDSSKGIPYEFLEEMKSDLGIYDESRDYNQIIMGYGTGLMPPSNEEWDIIGNQWSLSGDFVEGSSLPLSFDNSSSIFFPPIGDQGTEGSCVAFSQGYYTATFYEARDNGWNMTNADWLNSAPTSSFLSKIMSPDFVYHLINNGVDKGSSYVDAQNVIGSIGISSWAEMPYDVSDSTSWPNEDAWREAPKYRNGNAQSNLVIRVENDTDIQTLKSYLASGWLVSISIDANNYASLSQNDVWSSLNYSVISTNHANTIVGYDDKMACE